MDGTKAVMRVMRGKRTARRRQAFLEALAASGNVRASCKAVGIAAVNIYVWRREDPGFAADWLKAVKAADARLKEGEGPAPGTLIRKARGGRTQVRFARPGEWGPETDKTFLSTLSATANVRRAAAAAGFSTSAAYARRRQWPAFRDAWDAALDDGITQLEWLLVEHATNLMRPTPPAGDATPGTEGEASPAPPAPAAEALPPDPSLALQLIKHHRAIRSGARRANGVPPRQPDMEAVRRSVLDRLAALDRFEARRER